MAVLLFVYGTLKRGHPNHGQLRRSSLVGSAITEPRYTLLDMGPWPGLAEGGNTAVFGEVYQVRPSMLPLLDAFEGVPHLFVRDRVSLQPAGPTNAPNLAYAYFLASSPVSTGKIIPSGRWPP